MAAVLDTFTWPLSPSVPLLTRPPKAERVATSSPELDRVRSALAAIPNDESVDYDQWRDIAFAVHYATDGSDEGLELFREWSVRSPKHEDEFLDNRVWPYIQSDRDGDLITDRTLFARAERSGWVDPALLDDFEVLEDAPATPGRFQFVQAAKFSAGRPPGWIIKNVLPRAELVVLYGESGAGKSFTALDLLAAIARGVPWRGHHVTPGLAGGYIAAEGAAGFRNRLQAYAQHHEVDLAALPLAIMAGAPNFMEAKDVIDLGHAMRAYGRLDILVVDTLARVTPGANENSGEDMGRVIAHCDTLHRVTGATILLIHHSGKDASRGARGWSGIKGAVDAELEVTRCENDRVLSITKMKDGPGEGSQYGFRLLDVPLGMDDDGEVYGSCVVEHKDGAVKKGGTGPKGKNEMLVHKIVLDLIDLGGDTEIEEVVGEYVNRVPHDALASRDTRRQHATRALRSLVDKGLFVVEGSKVRVG